MDNKHPNSRTITIFRAGSYLTRAQGPEVQQILNLASVSVGSYFEGHGSTAIATGLSFSEQDLLMPFLVDCAADRSEFRKLVTEYFANLDTKILPDTGTVLEIGLEKDNDKPLSRDTKNPENSNMPLNISDFVRYRVAKGHPFMAQNREEAEGNPNKQYYIFDKSATQKKNTSKIKERDAAMQIYLQIKGDENKVDSMLTLFGTDPREYSGVNAMDNKVEKLRELSEEDPKKFTETYNAGELEARYWIKTMVNTGVFKLLNGKYYDADSNKLLCNTDEEMIAWFIDEDNSETVVLLKARMQEQLKKPIHKQTKRTVRLGK